MADDSIYSAVSWAGKFKDSNKALVVLEIRAGDVTNLIDKGYLIPRSVEGMAKFPLEYIFTPKSFDSLNSQAVKIIKVPY